VFSSPYTP
jgi:hypothetical protein